MNRKQVPFLIKKCIFRQASVKLELGENFHFTPHKLRHTFMKKAANKHRLQFAYEASGNVCIRQTFRYAKLR